MGRKNRVVENVGKRRPVLQLDDSLKKDSDRSKEEKMREKPDNEPVPAGLSLLGTYADSDEEASGEQPRDLDSKLADFMAEIDALSVPPPPCEPEVVESSTGDSAEHVGGQCLDVETQHGVEVSTAWHYDTHNSAASSGIDMGDWHEVWEESMECYYYWNVATNEVTWELPSALALQVKNVEQLNNGDCHGVPDTSSATSTITHSDSLAPQPKASVIGKLTAQCGEEEECVGVAQTLLAPLIPESVRLEEEKWRQKFVSGTKNEVQGDDIDGEELELDDDNKSEQLVEEQEEVEFQEEEQEEDEEEEEEEEDKLKKGEVEENDTSGAVGEDGDDDYNLQLRLALERKKAELKELEESDSGSKCSTPRAEPEDCEGAPSEQKKWKLLVKTSSPQHITESNQISTQEGVAPKDSEMTALAVASVKKQDVEDVPTKNQTEEEEEIGQKFAIAELANVLTDKLGFLGISTKIFSNFHLLLVEIQTRLMDWREGALSSHYLWRKLEDANTQIREYEMNAAPSGWACHWHRTHCRYFYIHEDTGRSQWEFPSEVKGVNKSLLEMVDSGQVMDTGGTNEKPIQEKQPCKTDETVLENAAPPAPPAPPVLSDITSTTLAILLQHSPPLPPEDLPAPPLPSDSPPPLPPPPDSPPPPPSPPHSQPQPHSPSQPAMEIEEVEMEMDNTEPPPPGMEDVEKSLVPKISSSDIDKDGQQCVARISKATKRKAPTAIISAPPVISRSVTSFSSIVAPYSPSDLPSEESRTCLATPVAWSGIMELDAPPIQDSVLPPAPTHLIPVSLSPAAPLAPVAEKSKRGKKVRGGKSKGRMPPLVEKWKSIQRELEDEEREESEEEELNPQQRIKEWKMQQLLTGKAERNPNFEALPIDWRERLKRRKTTPKGQQPQ
uniref:formin-binding protein 4 isoform X2 n=1 Tax=Myxine glutinosa TaxID=7769 RepID=UPI00358E6082